MAYDEGLEARIDELMDKWEGYEKRRMFGGICYLKSGNMAFGIWKDFLIVRMEKDAAAQSLKGKNVRSFDITGRPMAGWVMVDEAGWQSAAGLETWTAIGKKFALSLPEKTGKAKAKKTKTLMGYRGHDRSR